MTTLETMHATPTRWDIQCYLALPTLTLYSRFQGVWQYSRAYITANQSSKSITTEHDQHSMLP